MIALVQNRIMSVVSVGVVLLAANGRTSEAFSSFVVSQKKKYAFSSSSNSSPKRAQCSRYAASKPALIRMNLSNDLDNADAYPEGEDLVKALYEEVRIREFRERLEDMETDWEERMMIDEDRSRAPQNRESFMNRREITRQPMDMPAFPPRSGSNADASNTSNNNNAGFFQRGEVNSLFSSDRNNLGGIGGGGSFLNRNNNNNDVRSNMMRQEFDMVSGATSGTSFFLQAGLILVTLAFYLYVGLTGGITDGAERIAEDATTDFNSYFDNVDLGAVLEKTGATEIRPNPTDGSIWL